MNDCVIWGMFNGSNNTVSLADVPYKGSMYRIKNNLFPFAIAEVRGWPCSNTDIASQLLTANEESYFVKWLAGRELSAEAWAVMEAGRTLYRKFYAEIVNTNWMECKISTWDVGFYQISKALKEAGLAAAEFAALKTAHDALRAKLLPKVYDYGFLNPDVEYFT